MKTLLRALVLISLALPAHAQQTQPFELQAGEQVTHGIVCDTPDQARALMDLAFGGGYDMKESAAAINGAATSPRCVVERMLIVRPVSVVSIVEAGGHAHLICECELNGAVARTTAGLTVARARPTRQFCVFTRRIPSS